MKRSVVLLIDSRDRETAFIGTAEGGEVRMARRVPIFGATHRILTAVRRLVKSSEISGVTVAVGPGSFTAVRMGVVVANALAYGLSVPILGVRIPTSEPPSRHTLDILAARPAGKRGIVLPVYARPPSITKRRKR